ncbi:hypothetical protein CYLTODRAFT_412737 [Cylindrobasidium torrendii FP15055 ss-10]|uniref:Uncharacterized protein n=1 Tax=Cylindrobasidium torrendii FP15055 ss-10 TaxID=1314674 RepID=A0A0D7B431_9AGAR|nr:hypothetical protein CYLTODRAFT_412737 [Cylindrobasidium torrendii FP15055 ss-10]
MSKNQQAPASWYPSPEFTAALPDPRDQGFDPEDYEEFSKAELEIINAVGYGDIRDNRWYAFFNVDGVPDGICRGWGTLCACTEESKSAEWYFMGHSYDESYQEFERMRAARHSSAMATSESTKSPPPEARQKASWFYPTSAPLRLYPTYDGALRASQYEDGRDIRAFHQIVVAEKKRVKSEMRKSSTIRVG